MSAVNLSFEHVKKFMCKLDNKNLTSYLSHGLNVLYLSLDHHKMAEYMHALGLDGTQLFYQDFICFNHRLKGFAFWKIYVAKYSAFSYAVERVTSKVQFTNESKEQWKVDLLKFKFWYDEKYLKTDSRSTSRNYYNFVSILGEIVQNEHMYSIFKSKFKDHYALTQYAKKLNVQYTFSNDVNTENKSPELITNLLHIQSNRELLDKYTTLGHYVVLYDSRAGQLIPEININSDKKTSLTLNDVIENITGDEEEDFEMEIYYPRLNVACKIKGTYTSTDGRIILKESIEEIPVRPSAQKS